MHEHVVIILLKFLEWHERFLIMGMSGILMKDFLATVVQQIEVIFIDSAAEIFC